MYVFKCVTCIARVSFKSRVGSLSSKYAFTCTTRLFKPICSQVFIKFCSTQTQDSKKIKDQNIVIYVGPLTKQIRNVKLFSFISSMAGLFSQPYVYARAMELNMSTGLLVTLISIMGIFTFITPLLLHYVTKKLNFKPGDGYLPSTPAMFTTISVNGTPLLVDPTFFDDIEHYKKIMGFDKPMDFKLGPSK